jgi:hypothetical protein
MRHVKTGAFGHNGRAKLAPIGCTRFAKKNFSLISEIKRNWIRFTYVSFVHYKISLLFFRFKFFALLHFSNFRFKGMRNSSLFFCFFLLFLLFFALNFSLRFDLVIFASKRNEGENFFASKDAKFNIFHIISLQMQKQMRRVKGTVQRNF